MTAISNVRLYKNDTPDNFVCTENGKITSVGKGQIPSDGKIIDGKGLILYRGLCDVHTHGARLIDFTLCDEQNAVKLEDWYASCGVTSVFPTTTTQTFSQILTAVDNIAKASQVVTKTHFDGVHIEGPFLSHKRRGAHNEALLALPDVDFAKRILEKAGNLKVRMTVAPEIDGAIDFIRACTKMGMMITLGHSIADFDTVMRAFDAGADCVTHTFNGMDPLHHRNPGLLGAALAEDVYAEIICDGLHVNPEVVKLFSKVKSQEKAVLITDSITLAGCDESDGIQESAGLKVHMVDGAIRTVDTGDFAGSSLKLCQGVKNYTEFTGKSLDDAVNCASLNPSTLCGLSEKIGSIAVGKRADLVLLDDDGKLKMTVCSGKVVFED